MPGSASARGMRSDSAPSINSTGPSSVLRSVIGKYRLTYANSQDRAPLLLELEHPLDRGQVSRLVSAVRDRVTKPVEGSEARVEERALGELRVERYVIGAERSLEKRPAAEKEHVAEVSRRISEPTAPINDAGKATGRSADQDVLRLEIVVNESRRPAVGVWYTNDAVQPRAGIRAEEPDLGQLVHPEADSLQAGG